MEEVKVQKNVSTKKKKVSKRASSSKNICGLIMPISALDGCSEQHWGDVREILETAIADAGFEARLVSDADEVGIIQKRIIQNVYDDPIVVCDVSGKNPNVMFELGMRLAFDKPTIIIKDDKTTYTFDTAPIEHLEYPRDLRFAKIVEFQESLTSKIEATFKKSQTDKTYTTFLKNFGSFSVAKLESKAMDKNDFVLEELRTLKSLLLRQPRVMDESMQRLVSEDRDRTHAQMAVIRHGIERVMRRVSPGTPKDKMRGMVMEEILSHTPGATKYFCNPSELERAVIRRMKVMGLLD